MLTVLLHTGINQAMFVNIPEAKVLRERFRYTTFVHFVENTDLIEKLAGKNLDTLNILTEVDAALRYYVKSFKDRVLIVEGIGSLYLNIVELILKDSPDKFKELKAIIDEAQNNSSD